MFSGLLLCLLAAVAYACPPTAPGQNQTGYGMAGRSKRSVGCNPADLIIEAVTKTNFGTPESNEKTALMIRSKILQLVADMKVQTEKYGDFVRSQTSNNGLLTVQYIFANSVEHCGDFMQFAQIGLKEIDDIGKVIVTCGCEEPKSF